MIPMNSPAFVGRLVSRSARACLALALSLGFAGGLAPPRALAAPLPQLSSPTASPITPQWRPTLAQLLHGLRVHKSATMQAVSDAGGWPAQVAGGFLYVSCDPSLTLLAGDHDGWTGTPMTPDLGFHWLVLNTPPGARYKFTDLITWQPDPWSRAYEYDNFGLMSLRPPLGTQHLERYFNVADANMAARTVRVQLPAGPATHVLYAQDGQNLFDPNALWGGWQLDQSAPPAMMIVGIDNSPARLDEYTHVQDDIGSGPLGGQADDYADFVELRVRPLIASHYREPAKVGVIGSSLGGLVAYEIAHRYPGEYDFAASLSGTMGWGSIGAGVHNQTMIERYVAAGHQSTVLYLDSGGSGTTCADSDSDGIQDDDSGSSDNFCENQQLFQSLGALGYTPNLDLWYVWAPGAAHNEAAWAARVGAALQIFANL